MCVVDYILIAVNESLGFGSIKIAIDSNEK